MEDQEPNKKKTESEYKIIDVQHLKKSLRRFRNLLKENLSLIILVPTVLGGIWQLYELSQISISYIHFFSISQLVPDGLMVLVFLFILFLQFYFAYKVISEPEEIAGYRHLYLKNRNSKVKDVIVIVLFSIATGYGTYLMYSYISKINNVNQFFMLMVWVNGGLFIGVSILSFFLSTFKLYDRTTLTKLKYFFTVPLLYYSIMFTYHFKNYLHLPKDLVNIKYIEYSDFTKGSRVVYYNDKYVFIQQFDLVKFEKTGQYNLTNRVIGIDNLINDKDSKLVVPKGYIYRVNKAFKTIDGTEQIKKLYPLYGVKNSTSK